MKIEASSKARKGLKPFARNGIITKNQRKMLITWLTVPESRIITTSELLKKVGMNRQTFYNKAEKYKDHEIDFFTLEQINSLIQVYNDDVEKQVNFVNKKDELSSKEKEKLDKVVKGMTDVQN